jgi:RNA polymerase sigma-70 factor (ECF subfamily)
VATAEPDGNRTLGGGVYDVMARPDAAFTALFEAHHAAVLAYALRRTSSAADAEDVAAETFATAWRRRADVPVDALPWLYGVARRVLANQRRGLLRWSRLRERLTRTQDSAGLPTDGGPATRALHRLRPDDQEVLRLIAWEGLSHAEIAITLEVSVNAVAIRLHRARGRFADELMRVRADDLKGSEPSRTSTPVKGTGHEETR